MVAARAIADRNIFVDRAYRVAILQATGHYLDPVSSFAAALVVFDGLVARLSPRDAGCYFLIYKGFTEPIRVIPSVPQ
ncbi:MAG: hypothetical protein ACJASV_001487 [Pseudorhodobacter sp.]|jgi:hypothetical protein